MANEKPVTAVAVRKGVKLVKITAEFTVPLAEASLLGGKANGVLTKEERYAAFYLRHAIKDLHGVIIKQEDVVTAPATPAAPAK